MHVKDKLTHEPSCGFMSEFIFHIHVSCATTWTNVRTVRAVVASGRVDCTLEALRHFWASDDDRSVETLGRSEHAPPSSCLAQY